MSWFEKIEPVMVTRSGRCIETFGDASVVMMALPEYDRRNAQWRLTAQLLIHTAEGEVLAPAIVRAELLRMFRGLGLL